MKVVLKDASPMLLFAMKAAHAGGDVLMRHFYTGHSIRNKGWQDIVSEADIESQRSIADVLRETSIDVIGEECDNAEELIASSGKQWVVDPLDGTNNYVRHLRTFCVSIALVDNGNPVVGVIYDPLSNETLFAEQGKEAFCIDKNGGVQQLRVSTETSWEKTIIGTDWPREPEKRKAGMVPYEKIVTECVAVRTIGSVAMGMTYVARGSLDGYYHFSMKPWDAAAAAIIARESGASVSSGDGRPWSVRDSSIVVANEKFSRTLVEAIDCRKDR